MKKFFVIVVALALVAGFALLGFSRHAQAQDATQNFFQLRYSDAEAALSQALADKGAAQRVQANIAGKQNAVLYDYHKPMTLSVKTLNFDAKTSQFSANLYIMSEGEVVSAMPISGRYQEMVEAPVLKRNVRNGEVIEASDLDFVTFPAKQARNNTIMDPDSLIGKSPKRSISAMRMVRADELAEPAVMKKDAMITMAYRMPGMEITTAGVALENGAKGDVIAVRNVNSKQVVRAVVQAANEATVTSGLQSAQLNQGGNYAAQ